MFVIVDCDALFPPPVYIPCFSSFFPIVKDTLTRRRERESFFCLFALLSTGQIKADGPVLLARAPETETRNWFDSFFFFPTQLANVLHLKSRRIAIGKNKAKLWSAHLYATEILICNSYARCELQVFQSWYTHK